MHAIVRTYEGEGAAEIFDLIEELETEVRDLMSGVPGFVSYTAARSDDGGVSVTICESKEGTDESSRRAGKFIKDRAKGSAGAPRVTEGDTILHMRA